MAEDNKHTEQQTAGAAAGMDRRTRRRLLAGAAGVLGVAAAEVVGAAGPAQADNGNPVLQGTDNGHPTARTAVMTSGNTEVGILADPNTSGKGSLGVYGIGNNIGVFGQGGGSNSAGGVFGLGGPSGGVGVTGQGGAGGNGGVGVSGTGVGLFGPGVTGQGSGTGPGVWGSGNGGPGVRGTSGIGSQPGVLAENTGSGPALHVSGPAAFSRSGLLTVAAGKSSATQTGVALSSASLVLATLQQNLAGAYVRAAVPNITGSSFTVYLNKTVTAPAKIAWFVVN